MPRKKHGRGRGFGHGRRHGRGLRAGRPRIQPAIEKDFAAIRGETTLLLLPSELEALRLIDEENLIQEEAAVRMNISRGSFWRILASARKKVTTALLSGQKIHVMVNQDSISTEEE
ncbi:MAG: DUF134 domain-containing protein [Candidatus Hodarchaeales archaeon]|jgi:predicted DNA-binding protein (UPF0251 family)